MSTYYDYRDVKVMIAHKLMSMEGWKVYGYKKDESDSMIDYYSPANWNGVAEKNGYILCVNVYGAAKEEEIRKYNYSGFSYSKDIQEKITKVAPFAGAWIEIRTGQNLLDEMYGVAPFTGAWIEIKSLAIVFFCSEKGAAH